MLKSVLKKGHLEEQLAFAPRELRPALEKEYKKVTQNIESRLLANTSIVPHRIAPTKVGTGKYKPPVSFSFGPPVRVVKGSKRTFIVTG